ncbi:MAG: hypothetical protein U0Z53_21180 [Blastocatellia bacterium]
MLLDFLLLALVAGLVLLPAGALAFSLLPTGAGAAVLFLPPGAVLADLAGRAEALVAALGVTDDFLPLVVRGLAACLVLAEPVLAGRDFCAFCLDDALPLDRDVPAVVLVLVCLIFGMPCDRSGVGEIISRCYPVFILYSKIHLGTHQLPGIAAI